MWLWCRPSDTKPTFTNDHERAALPLEGARLDGVVPGERVGGRGVDRLLPVSAADHVDAGDEFVGLEKRPVAEVRLAVPDTQRRGGLRTAERSAEDIDAARLQPLPPGLGLLQHRLLVQRFRRRPSL